MKINATLILLLILYRLNFVKVTCGFKIEFGARYDLVTRSLILTSPSPIQFSLGDGGGDSRSSSSSLFNIEQKNYCSVC